MSDDLYARLPTEQRSDELRDLDTKGALELVDLIHGQDLRALSAVGAARREIAAAVERIAEAIAAGGRLIYVGAGTSGRLAALDAAECPPTFGSDPGKVVACIAGGPKALARAVEGAEDSRLEGRRALRALDARPPDVVCGVSASGVTPFVQAALAEAQRRGCSALLVTCAPLELAREHADLAVCLAVGAEAVAGSTRMKGGLATKAVLHTLTTAAMIRLGKVYDNLMVDLRPTSHKLKRRAARIVQELTGLTPAAAARLLGRAGGSPKLAVLMCRRELDRKRASELLERAGGSLREALGARESGDLE